MPTKAEKVQAVLDAVVADFEAGNVADRIARVTFDSPTNIPQAKWSLHNRILAAIGGTSDARGFRQWNAAGRKVTKGSKAIYILGPRMVEDRDAEPGPNGKRPKILIGFVGIPVFRVEDTEGDALDYGLPQLPDHPLMDVAERWGVKVEAAGFDGSTYGWAAIRRDRIVLCTTSEAVWFHELGHVADGKGQTLKGGQHADQEIVAELTATALARMVGRQLPEERNAHDYISRYACAWFPKATPEEAMRKACHRVLSRTCKAIERILEEADKAADTVAAA